MKDAIYSDLLPSAEMVLSMKQEFGAISWMVEEEGSLASNHHELHKSLESLRTRRKTRKPLDNYNPEYVAWKQLASQEHSMDIKNYIQNNIDEVHQASETLQKVKPAVLVATPAVGKQAHNYSIQTENSTTQAWELLLNEMAKQPKRRFTYSQDYHSATVVPVDVVKERKASEAMSMAAWRTPDGFIYPGFKSSMEANEHPRHPDEARVEELGKPWRENVLHGSKLKPPLTRDTLWLWSRRHQDFERYLNPSNLFDPDAPLTINLAGESLQQEQQESARAQDRWLKKMVVNRDSSKPGCIPEFKCHMAQGKAGKVEGLLKDKPMKYSLRNPKMALKPIPAVSVIQHSEVTYPEDTEHNVFVPGPLSEHSLCFNNNFLPRYTSDSNKFCFQKSCSFLYKRAAPPLTAEERPTFLFSRPATAPKRPPIDVQTPVARKVVQTRTHKDLFVHVA